MAVSDAGDGTTGGPPDVIASPPPPGRRPWLIATAALVAVAVGGVLLTRGGEEQPSAATPTTAVTTTSTGPTTTTIAPPTGRRPAATSAPVDPADITSGELPDVLGLPIGTTALRAAQTVAEGYCARIGSWVIRLEPIDGYEHVVALLRPSGPAYPNVALQIDLTWDTDHYLWRASRSALEDCP